MMKINPQLLVVKSIAVLDASWDRMGAGNWVQSNEAREKNIPLTWNMSWQGTSYILN